MGYTIFREATVQMLPDFCSDKIGFSVQVRRILHLYQILQKTISSLITNAFPFICLGRIINNYIAIKDTIRQGITGFYCSK
jgi:hypothetical protein